MTVNNLGGKTSKTVASAVKRQKTVSFSTGELNALATKYVTLTLEVQCMPCITIKQNVSAHV